MAEAEGVPEHEQGLPDIDTWLKDNKLTDAAETFKKRGVELEELLEFDEEDLKAFAGENGLGLKVLSRSRFLKGVKKLQAMASPPMHNESKSKLFSTNKPKRKDSKKKGTSRSSTSNVRVIVSAEEHRAMRQLHEALDKTNSLRQSIVGGIEKLEQSEQHEVAKINALIDGLIRDLQRKHKTMLSECDDLSAVKEKRLKKQMDGLEKHLKTVFSASFCNLLNIFVFLKNKK